MIYFDHNASTPVRPEAREAMTEALAGSGANPSSAHREGQRARAAVERAREQVAALVGASPAGVTFVSGGTEGDHLSVAGMALALETRGRTVAVSSIEHHAVHGAGDLLARLGFHVTHLPVNARGFLDPAALPGAGSDHTLVAVMLANNETGVIQPVAEIAARAHAAGLAVQCDAVQAAGKIPVDFGALGVDALVISAHKLGGPKGIGALILRDGTPCEPLFRGSAHESGRRGGTENLPGIVGFGVAAECAARELASESTRMLALRARLEGGIRAVVPDAVIHGERAPRLPNTVNASFPGARSDRLLMALDARGVCVSAGAACASGAVEPSPVLAAMGVPRELAVCALRLSMGRGTSADDVDRVIVALGESVRGVRGAAAAAGASGA